jgi:uncharacterized protein (TIGR03000 family)
LYGVVFVAVGALLGYLAASSNLAFFQRAEAAGLRAEAVAAADDEQVIEFVVLLPATAILEIGSTKTKESGGERTFQTPPLKVGGRYYYTLKATVGDKVVTRQIHLTHGGTNSIDLRPDFQPGGASGTGLQTTGVPGSANATTTINGKQLPPPPPQIRRRDQGKRQGFQALVAAANRAAQGCAQHSAHHDRRPGLWHQ